MLVGKAGVRLFILCFVAFRLLGLALAKLINSFQRLLSTTTTSITTVIVFSDFFSKRKLC